MKIRKKSAKIENFKMKSSRPKIVFLVSGTQKNGLELENQNFVFASGGVLKNAVTCFHIEAACSYPIPEYALSSMFSLQIQPIEFVDQIASSTPQAWPCILKLRCCLAHSELEKTRNAAGTRSRGRLGSVLFYR